MALEKALESYIGIFVKRPTILLVLAGLFILPSCLHADTAPDKFTTFFVGRLKYANNDGNDCGSVAEELGHLLSRASTITVQDEKKIRLADDDSLFETPFLFMDGHDDFVLSDTELGNLRRYFAHGGFMLASGCCSTPGFPIAWRREMNRVFPGEVVQKIPYDHLIYHSFYNIDHVENLENHQDVLLDGLYHDGQLVAVMCQDGLVCSFAMGNECNKGHGIDPEEARKLALNIAVYSLTH
jgi:Domain of unknown function (DUF4159)